MALTKRKLRTWKKHETAATESGRVTHERVRNVLEEEESTAHSHPEMSFKTLLQGSYKNYTLVRGSGDVDILVIMENPYTQTTTSLSRDKRKEYRNDRSTWDHDYDLADFKQGVVQTLREKYEDAVTVGNKAIEIDSDHSDSPLPSDADVVPCQRYRRYHTYRGDPHDEGVFFKGIKFESKGGTEIVNFPYRHREKAKEKQERTNENYLETIRIFKNARNELVDRGRLSKDKVPSYQIECLLSNVPDNRFTERDLRNRYRLIVDYLQDTNLQSFGAQHGLEDLFGRDETKWRKRYAMSFIDELDWLYTHA